MTRFDCWTTEELEAVSRALSKSEPDMAYLKTHIDMEVADRKDNADRLKETFGYFSDKEVTSFIDGTFFASEKLKSQAARELERRKRWKNSTE